MQSKLTSENAVCSGPSLEGFCAWVCECRNRMEHSLQSKRQLQKRMLPLVKAEVCANPLTVEESGEQFRDLLYEIVVQEAELESLEAVYHLAYARDLAALDLSEPTTRRLWEQFVSTFDDDYNRTVCKCSSR